MQFILQIMCSWPCWWRWITNSNVDIFLDCNCCNNSLITEILWTLKNIKSVSIRLLRSILFQLPNTCSWQSYQICTANLKSVHQDCTTYYFQQYQTNLKILKPGAYTKKKFNLISVGHSIIFAHRTASWFALLDNKEWLRNDLV